jgi:general stress protein 26
MDPFLIKLEPNESSTIYGDRKVIDSVWRSKSHRQYMEIEKSSTVFGDRKVIDSIWRSKSHRQYLGIEKVISLNFIKTIYGDEPNGSSY